MITAGIDAGSRAIKVVLFDHRQNRIIGSGITDQGVDQSIMAMDLLDTVLLQNKLEKSALSGIIATGYGRDSIETADETVTEITCHAKGVRHEHPDCRTIIDIGGQDSKLIRLRHENGHVRDFVMNDRCAAGTGRFIEIVAERLELDLKELGKTASEADDPSPISSMCVVFAETEIVGLLAAGEKKSNIIAGVQSSIATRISSMAGRNLEEPIIFTGGVALASGMQDALQESLSKPITIAERPQYTGALGAAILAGDNS